MRYLQAFIQADLKKKMVFLGGPRQVGKTLLCLACLREHLGISREGLEGSDLIAELDLLREHEAYLNWDVAPSKKKLIRAELAADQGMIVIDEVHKYRHWRSLLKGFFDQYKAKKKFLITGSARLDYYRRGGDSLLGRYHYLRLHPFSLTEVSRNVATDEQALEDLLKFGGFPEPFSMKDPQHHRRWQLERNQRVVEDDLRDLEKIDDISAMHVLVDVLESRVGSPLSIKSLAGDLEKSHATIKRYLEILERIYFCYRISPYGTPRIRAVKKEQKLYLWDWSQVEDSGARFENLVASQLLKYCDFVTDTQGYRMELRFLRDTDKREIDFVVLQNRKPLFAVECKSGEKSLSPHIAYYRARTPIPKFYQVHLGKKDVGDPETGGRLIPFAKFCRELGLP